MSTKNEEAIFLDHIRERIHTHESANKTDRQTEYLKRLLSIIVEQKITIAGLRADTRSHQTNMSALEPLVTPA